MPHKQVLYGAKARGKVLNGATLLADAVRVTLGPKSKPVLIEKNQGTPIVCPHGVTIAKEFDLKDPEENLGARMLRAAAEKTGALVGDGTCTSTIIAHAILVDGHRNVAAGASAIELKRGFDRALTRAVLTLRELSRPVTTHRETQHVAAMSAHSDGTVGELIAEAIAKVGKEGVITIEESKSTETKLHMVDGMQIDRGYISSSFATDIERMETMLEDVKVLIFYGKISTSVNFVDLLEEIARTENAILVIGGDIEDEALSILIANQTHGTLRNCAVKAPGFGNDQKAILQDIAVFTGGQLITQDLDLKVKDAAFDQLGCAARVIIDKDTTTIVSGGGKPEAIRARADQIRREIENSTSDYDREYLQERLAKLTGVIAVIRVGASGEPEMKAKKEAFHDAINATKAAIQEGIVPGGGLALLRCVNAVAAEEDNCTGDERTGVQILKRALEVPARQIAENSAADSGIVVARMLETDGAIGFDAVRHCYVDFFEEGIVDPTKVVRVGLENAVSVASLLLLTETTMTELPDAVAPQPPLPIGI